MSLEVRFKCPETFYPEFERKGAQEWTTHYCPGCGHGLIHKYLAEAIADFGAQDKTVLISPVGCAVFAYYYFDVGNVQVPHGRCPAAATAVKRAHPESLVVGYQGDGDLAAIGGNEILQAANRGENITIFFVNNAIYGMTGGQLAPTSLIGMRTTTTPAGRDAHNEGFPLRVCELLSALDAPYYLERVAVGDPRHNHKARLAIRKAIKNQLDHKGFSLVEILSPCPTGWKLSPVEAASFTLEKMVETFPLRLFRDGHELDLGHPRLHPDVPLSEIPALIDAQGEATQIKLPDHRVSIEDAAIKISGFGGQGVLLAGMVLAQAGMLARRQVSWMPSYGPEMRGGTAYCNVTLSDAEIGTPLIEHPTILVAMNGPSLDRFGPDVEPGGVIFYNSSMIDQVADYPGVTIIPVAATEIATTMGNQKVANIVMLGAMLGHGCAVSKDAVLAALPSVVKSQPELMQLNLAAIEAGIRTVTEGCASPVVETSESGT